MAGKNFVRWVLVGVWGGGGVLGILGVLGVHFRAGFWDLFRQCLHFICPGAGAW